MASCKGDPKAREWKLRRLQSVFGDLCRGYERGPEPASISYPAIRIFASQARNAG